MAVIGQVREGVADGLELDEFAVDLAHMCQYQLLHPNAGTAMVAPQPHQLAHILQGKAKLAGPMDEVQGRHVALIVAPVVADAARRWKPV